MESIPDYGAVGDAEAVLQERQEQIRQTDMAIERLEAILKEDSFPKAVNDLKELKRSVTDKAVGKILNIRATQHGLKLAIVTAKKNLLKLKLTEKILLEGFSQVEKQAALPRKISPVKKAALTSASKATRVASYGLYGAAGYVAIKTGFGFVAGTVGLGPLGGVLGTAAVAYGLGRVSDTLQEKTLTQEDVAGLKRREEEPPTGEPPAKRKRTE